MGGWKLEVFRMSAYVAMPILCFYLFNKPEYFKEYLVENKSKFYMGTEKEAVGIPFFFQILYLFEVQLANLNILNYRRRCWKNLKSVSKKITSSRF
jgi:hypothetical protein